MSGPPRCATNCGTSSPSEGVPDARTETWRVFRSGLASPAYNMALDEGLLENAPSVRIPTLRFYGWSEAAASFGYFQRYAEIEQQTVLRPLVRRPTGGGLVPHDADWTYSLVFPTGHEWYGLPAIESYRRLHEWVQAAFARLGVAAELAAEARKSAPGHCFVGYERFDLIWRGRKIAGAAQRRRRDGLLIQGSVQPPPLRLDRENWETAMLEAAAGRFGACWQAPPVPEDVRARALALARQKYSSPEYNRSRN